MRELGRGGMATVYLAQDIKHDREVAIKVLHPELGKSPGAAGRFEREIRLAAKLQHPHILGLHDSGVAGDLLYYVMPFVKGESLRDRIDREGMLPVDDAIAIALEVNDALGYAHSQGVIHRDIKPENILLSGGHALVADFGIARAMSTEGGVQKLTATGMSMGTPYYMPPEQAAARRWPDRGSVRLGCVLYEMLAGEPPFNGKNAMQVMARHAMEQVPSIRIVRSSVPEEVEEAIFAALGKAPADRPQTRGAVRGVHGADAWASRRACGSRTTMTRRVPIGYAGPAHADDRAAQPASAVVAAPVVVGGALGIVVVAVGAFGVVAFSRVASGNGAVARCAPDRGALLRRPERGSLARRGRRRSHRRAHPLALHAPSLTVILALGRRAVSRQLGRDRQHRASAARRLSRAR